MIGWIINWFRARSRQKKRCLYEFWDGRHFRKVDPWTVYRAVFNDSEFHPGNHYADAVLGSEPENTYLCNCVCKAFGVERYNVKTGRGLTEGELTDLLTDFMLWLEELQKKSAGSLTSSPTTDQPPSSSPASAPSTISTPSPWQRPMSASTTADAGS